MLAEKIAFNYSSTCLWSLSFLEVKEIFTLYPNACAYLKSVSIEGECRPLPKDSRREIAVRVVCIRCAISSWLIFAFSRFFLINNASSISRFFRSYNALDSGSDMTRFSIFAFTFLDDFLAFSKENLAILFYLFQTFFCQLQLTIRGCSRLFFKSTIKNTSYVIFRFQSDFKKAITHCARIRQSKIRPIFYHHLLYSKKVCQQIFRQTKNNSFNSSTVINKFQFHDHIVSNLLPIGKGNNSLSLYSF